MIVGRIANFTRILGPPDGWLKERDGHCSFMPIQDIQTEAGPAMMSVWEPTPDEIKRMQQGARVCLLILGEKHPPVRLSVGEVPK